VYPPSLFSLKAGSRFLCAWRGVATTTKGGGHWIDAHLFPSPGKAAKAAASRAFLLEWSTQALPPTGALPACYMWKASVLFFFTDRDSSPPVVREPRFCDKRHIILHPFPLLGKLRVPLLHKIWGGEVSRRGFSLPLESGPLSPGFIGGQMRLPFFFFFSRTRKWPK